MAGEGDDQVFLQKAGSRLAVWKKKTAGDYSYNHLPTHGAAGRDETAVTFLLHLLHLHDEAGYVFAIILIITTQDDYFSTVSRRAHQKSLYFFKKRGGLKDPFTGADLAHVPNPAC